MTEPVTEWSKARNILAVRLDNLGDVLLTTPALHAVKVSSPNARLTLLTSAVGVQVASLNEDIDEVIAYQAPWMDPWHTLPQDSEREQAMIAELKSHHFDAAIIFTSFRQSSLPAAYLCYLADIPLRFAASIDGPGSLLTTRHRHPERMMHEVERGLDLVAAVGFYSSAQDLVLSVPPAERVLAARIVEELREGDGPVVALHPGCSMPARTYPWDQYVGIADGLIERLGATVVLTGSTEERDLTARISGSMRGQAADIAGKLRFPTLCAVLQAADLVITNNTGPMHIAAAVKTPVVALFALTNPPEQWRPWNVPQRLLYHDVPCRLCYARVCPYQHECLRMVSPNMVVEAAGELLTETMVSGAV